MSIKADPDEISSPAVLLADNQSSSFGDGALVATGAGGPLTGHERTLRLIRVLPEERGLWQTLHYFPFSATWNEEEEKKLAVQHTRNLFISEYTKWYNHRENERIRQQSGMIRPPPPPAGDPNHGGARKGHLSKKKRPNKRLRYDPDDDYDDYCYDEEQIDQDDFANAIARSSLQNEESTRRRLEAEAKTQIGPYLAFLEALPECEPLTAGFMLLPVSSQKCCFCPCNYRLSMWRSKSVWKGDNEGEPPMSFQPCGNDRKGATVFHAPGILAHVSEFKESKNWWHWLIYEYLNHLFRHYMGQNHPHKAFLRQNSRQVRLAQPFGESACDYFSLTKVSCACW